MTAFRRVELGEPGARSETRQNVYRKTIRSRFKLVRGQPIGPDDCPFMRRWFLETPWGSIRLHHFIRSDDTAVQPVALHDHPWSFLTLVLAGGYRDISACPDCEGLGFIPVLAGTHRRVDTPGLYGEDEISYDPCGTCRSRGRLYDRLRAGSVRWRRAEHAHAVETEGAWTLCLTGPERRLWGFHVGGVFHRMADYFTRYGYAPCE